MHSFKPFKIQIVSQVLHDEHHPPTPHPFNYTGLSTVTWLDKHTYLLNTHTLSCFGIEIISHRMYKFLEFIESCGGLWFWLVAGWSGLRKNFLELCYKKRKAKLARNGNCKSIVSALGPNSPKGCKHPVVETYYII